MSQTGRELRVPEERTHAHARTRAGHARVDEALPHTRWGAGTNTIAKHGDGGGGGGGQRHTGTDAPGCAVLVERWKSEDGEVFTRGEVGGGVGAAEPRPVRPKVGSRLFRSEERGGVGGSARAWTGGEAKKERIKGTRLRTERGCVAENRRRCTQRRRRTRWKGTGRGGRTRTSRRDVRERDRQRASGSWCARRGGPSVCEKMQAVSE